MTNDPIPMPIEGGSNWFMLDTRIISTLVFLGCAAVLSTAAWLAPSASGIGTHTQLGLRECSWRIERGYICPTCGMTTAFALAAHGRLLDSFSVQPAGAFFAVLTAMALWIAGYTALTGCPTGWWLGRVVRPIPAIVGVTGVIALAWAIKLAGG